MSAAKSQDANVGTLERVRLPGFYPALKPLTNQGEYRLVKRTVYVFKAKV